MKSVFVVGAGPAGMFAARQVALAGHDVFLFNRDIKPGGLAEYGIYPTKDKMKFGLRKQFGQVLSLGNVHYFGNVQVGTEYDISIEDLEAMRPAAIIFACGAQGAGRLGLPGENAKGVYAAKDFVYHYNQLPPYASQDFSTGRRIGIIGMGNVAIDIARWLLEDDPRHVTEEVVIIARRGPLEIKFDEKEIGYIERHISREELIGELERVRERCMRVGQDVSPESIFANHFRHLKDPGFTSVAPRLKFRFLSSPTAVLPGPDGRIERIEVAENELVLKSNGDTAAKGLNEKVELNLDTLIFAIGDRHDPNIGLPMGPEGYATRPDPEHPQAAHFDVWDPNVNQPIPGTYVVGWARRASTGLVGIARHDGELGAAQAIAYLKDLPESDTWKESEILDGLRQKKLRPVTKSDLALLSAVEQRIAQERGLTSFKFSDNSSMFKAIREEKERTAIPSTEPVTTEK
ncbi:MAG TPA: FAD-dependent oxidoreductase [Terracidiphilus sp.]|nr:FAD-dependent oxidoreductase [Terracidiphilus sp.]